MLLGCLKSAFLETPVGQYSEALLRAANKASDAETRARHAAEYERDTGTWKFKPSWRDATRGAKLRSIDNIRTACQENVTALKKKLLKVKKAAKEQHLNMTPFFSDVKSTARIRLQKKQLELCDHMEQLILAEINEGWDWRTGIKEQMAIRKQQDRIVELLNIFVFLMDGI